MSSRLPIGTHTEEIAVYRIGPVEIARLSEARAIAFLGEIISGGGHAKIAFANAHFVNLAAGTPAFAVLLPQFMILPDGIGVDIGARLLYGAKFPANLNGTDFIPSLLRKSAAALRIGLVGARPGVAQRAAENLHRLAPHHSVEALAHGFLDAGGEAALIARLAAAPVDILLVAMGNPVQEQWIARHITGDHARLAFGVGALFDFLAGEVIRAPAALRALRLEWVWRLALEPRRLWRRYLLGNLTFLLRVMRQRLGV